MWHYFSDDQDYNLLLYNDYIVFSRYGIGVGIYDDGVYLDIRSEFMLWFDDFELLPDGVEFGDYLDQMEDRWANALGENIKSTIMEKYKYSLKC